ncbi:hypothetical protein [Brevibacillus porteri]|uniref:hypothetical protein n=1 Tax=Brevibacillus porteri TaxID=2126350 RepID=UPI003D25182A
MTIVNIVDAPCGYGKTSWAIQYMNDTDTGFHRFIYVTPFLDEVSRVRKSVQKRTFYEPTSSKEETKLEDLHRLLGQGKDIATTHALFQMANAETKELIRSNNYTLVLDEVMNVIEQVPLKKDDLTLLREAGAIDFDLNEKGLTYVRWINDKLFWDTKYNDIKQMALTNNLMFCDNSALIWNLPCDIFSVFRDVYILTYLFKGQLQKYYYDLHQIQYRYLSVVRDQHGYSLIPYQDRQNHAKTALNNLVSIYEGQLNAIGDKRNALSTSWFEKPSSKDFITTLQRNAYNFFTNMCKASNYTAIWTTVKGKKDSIMKNVKPKSFAKCFIPMTSRATNLYKEKFHLAYLVNRYMNPIEKKFFEQYGVKVDEDAWALSELIQWVWRSRIREGQSITIYIPSKRMRDLFIRYLTSDDFETPPENAIVDEPPSDWHI